MDYLSSTPIFNLWIPEALRGISTEGYGQDLVIGAFSDYDFDIIAPWILSLERSRFAGLKCVIVYNAAKSVIDALKARGFIVAHCADDAACEKSSFDFKGKPLVVTRFFHTWMLIKSLSANIKLRNCLFSDMRDLVFQTNPTDFLLQQLSEWDLIAAGEAVRYRHEPWGNENMLRSFGPTLHRHMVERPIYNAGCIAGKSHALSDLCLNIYLICENNPSYDPDQAALNVLLSLAPYRHVVKFTSDQDAWAFQAGTMANPTIREKIGPNFLDLPFSFDGQYVYNAAGRKYCILHQYDRVPGWAEAVRKVYAG